MRVTVRRVQPACAGRRRRSRARAPGRRAGSVQGTRFRAWRSADHMPLTNAVNAAQRLGSQHCCGLHAQLRQWPGCARRRRRRRARGPRSRVWRPRWPRARRPRPTCTSGCGARRPSWPAARPARASRRAPRTSPGRRCPCRAAGRSRLSAPPRLAEAVLTAAGELAGQCRQCSGVRARALGACRVGGGRVGRSPRAAAHTSACWLVSRAGFVCC